MSKHLLHKNTLASEIEIHTDLLSDTPSALSRKRALKTGRERQEVMDDRKGSEGCLLCHPEELKPVGSYPHRVLFADRIGHFDNDFPYLPGDQQVVYLWHSDVQKRTLGLHRHRLQEFGTSELYWLTKACIELGKRYPIPDRTYDLMRMVVGFNLGRLAGQSIPHFHIQYGWEVVLNRRTITENMLRLYFEELAEADLVIFENKRIKVVAPWTPKGQFAVDIYFADKYEIIDMDEQDLSILAICGRRIIEKYLSLGIQNLNIVFANSPRGRKIEPLVVHFVPRVNMSALYEIRGVNVVDTPPQKIAEEFRRHGAGDDDVINWVELCRQADRFDADGAFEREIAAAMQRQKQVV